MKTNKLRGLYAVTDATQHDPEKLLRDVEAALRGGARLVQYRDKSTDAALREHLARAMLALAEHYDALLIINDDVQLAKKIGAHGVHLGREDMPLGDARALLGAHAIIGVSCYHHLDLAQQAAKDGADYIAFGRVFPSRTKPGAALAGLDLIAHAKREFAIPVAAIGGITADNARTVIDAGADMIAVVEGLFGQADVEQTARNFTALFTP
jgi:thiamine-phosphate pyrophosphorylase